MVDLSGIEARVRHNILINIYKLISYNPTVFGRAPYRS